MPNNIYFKSFTVSDETMEIARLRASKRIEALPTLPERLDLTNETGSHKEHGYIGEELIFLTDNTVIRPNDDTGKVDYEKDIAGEKHYIDLKTMKTNTSIEDIISKKYSVYLLADQVLGACMYCQKNGISYDKYSYSIMYWYGVSNTFIRGYSDGLRLDKVLSEGEVIRGVPPNTYGSSEQLLQFKIKMWDGNVRVL